MTGETINGVDGKLAESEALTGSIAFWVVDATGILGVDDICGILGEDIGVSSERGWSKVIYN